MLIEKNTNIEMHKVDIFYVYVTINTCLLAVVQCWSNLALSSADQILFPFIEEYL